MTWTVGQRLDLLVAVERLRRSFRYHDGDRSSSPGAVRSRRRRARMTVAERRQEWRRYQTAKRARDRAKKEAA